MQDHSLSAKTNDIITFHNVHLTFGTTKNQEMSHSQEEDGQSIQCNPCNPHTLYCAKTQRETIKIRKKNNRNEHRIVETVSPKFLEKSAKSDKNLTKKVKQCSVTQVTSPVTQVIKPRMATW